MLRLGCTVDAVAREMGRRWRIRPREAYRHARGWSQDEVARRFAVTASRLEAEHVGSTVTARDSSASAICGVRIGEYERWPSGGRRPSVYALLILAEVFGTSVAHLLDYQDHRKIPDQDRAVLAAVHEARSQARGGRSAYCEAIG